MTNKTYLHKVRVHFFGDSPPEDFIVAIPNDMSVTVEESLTDAHASLLMKHSMFIVISTNDRTIYISKNCVKKLEVIEGDYF